MDILLYKYIFRYDVFSRKPFFSSIQGLRPRNRRKVLCVRQLLNLSVCTQHAAAWHSMSYKQQCQQTKVVKGNLVYLSITKLCSQTSDLRTKVHHLPAIYIKLPLLSPFSILHPSRPGELRVVVFEVWQLRSAFPTFPGLGCSALTLKTENSDVLLMRS